MVERIIKMKKLENFTRKERFDYISNFKGYKTHKHKREDAEIRYLFDNNTVEEITEWFVTKASTISYNGADLISVYMYNRISERLKGGVI